VWLGLENPELACRYRANLFLLRGQNSRAIQVTPMQTVLIVIHLMIVLALVGVVLLQRSEGGGLGIGGGSGFMSARSAANVLTRSTAILAACFFATSLLLSILARYGEKPTDVLDLVPATTQTDGKGVLDQLGGAAATKPADGAAAPVAPEPTGPQVPKAP
jgi:preprotein translocase subunit SecG